MEPVESFPQLQPFVDAVRQAYGKRLAGVYLFGSRARGTARAESDYDVAVVFEDDFAFWPEQARLADIAYDSMLSDDILVQPFPFTKAEWATGERDVLTSAREVAVHLGR